MSFMKDAKNRNKSARFKKQKKRKLQKETSAKKSTFSKNLELTFRRFFFRGKTQGQMPKFRKPPHKPKARERKSKSK